MPKRPVNLRLDAELWAEAKARHKELGWPSAGAMVEGGLRAVLEVQGHPLLTNGAPVSPQAPRATRTVPTQGGSKRTYQCPTPGCDFTAGSAKTRCPVHNKLVQ